MTELPPGTTAGAGRVLLIPGAVLLAVGLVTLVFWLVPALRR